MEDCKIPVQINVRERREHRDKGIQRKKIMGDETMEKAITKKRWKGTATHQARK